MGNSYMTSSDLNIDVFIAIAEVAAKHNFCFAEIDNSETNILEMKGVYHPLIPNAISNDITITEDNNMVFLTGANMAGKSIFMKSFITNRMPFQDSSE
ncbi:hypothetical protein L3073_16885 [Ancylomarina sp. DW003]|nr:hypothetical protein [Ancylomarina sp. DW003]MDE5423891.1 hypothetical protein [Ancylomarina sp. DW003]